jgi:uncharacterized protein (TIGR03437 family)
LALTLLCADALVRSQSSAPRRVTNAPVHTTSLNPTLSGDGRHIVFESTADLTGDGTGTHFRAFVADATADTISFSELAPTRAPAAAISQDGASIAFASAEDLTGENSDRNSEIFLSTAGHTTQITSTTPADASTRVRDGNFQPSISDDGGLVAFSSNRDLTGENADGNLEIFLYDVAAHKFTQLTNTVATIGASDAKLGGEGSRVAFIRDNAPANAPPSTARDLVIFNRVTKSFQTLAASVNALTLSPGRCVSDDGARVVYASETATNTSQVFLYDGRNGGILRQLTRLSSRVTDVPLAATISGDGARVAFATRRSVVGGNSDASTELYLYDLPTNGFTRLTDAPPDATAAVVASLNDDGSLVAFNFSRVLEGAVTDDDFSNNAEIFLSSLTPRVPFSNNLRLRHAALPDRDLAADKTLAPSQLAVARGDNLSLVSAQSQRQTDGSFPRVFKNVSVAVNQRPAQIFFIAPTQINFQIPDETETGAALVSVTNHDGYESRAVVQISRAAPGLFTERGDGTGAALALDAASQLRAPFDPHDGAGVARRVMILATGVRHAQVVSATIAGQAINVESIVPAPDLPGLDEVCLLLPRSLAGVGIVPLTLTANGFKSNQAAIQLAGTRQPARVVLAPLQTSLGVGRTLRLSASVFDEDGIEINDAHVSFSTDDTNVASVNADGEVRALREGVTKIIATAGNASAEMSLSVHTLSLAINEVLADPPDGAAGDANRDGQRSASQDEFVEIVNASDADIDLGGFRLVTRDESGKETTRHVFTHGAILAPGAAAVVFGGANNSTFNPRDPAFAGALVFNASTGGLSLLNGGDTIALLAPDGVTVEEMTYGGATSLEGDRNQSLARAPDILGDFTPHQSLTSGASRLFSPGTKVDGSPFETTAPVSRIEIDPQSATIPLGATQTFTARAFDPAGSELRGVIFDWRASDASVVAIDESGAARALKVGAANIVASARGVASAPASLTVTPPPRRVVRVEIDPPAASLNRGATQQFSARAFDRNDNLVPDTSFAWSSDNAAVATIDQSGLMRGVGIGIATVTATAGDGAGGTVAAHADIEVKLPILISEFLADVPPDDPATAAIEGDANRDGARNSGDDEFIELFNPSDAPVDLSGVRIADSTADRFTFPANTRLEAHRAVVVFGGGSPPATDPAFGGALILKTSALSLNDGGDTISVKLKVANDDVTLAAQSYGTQGGAPAPSDQSLTRERDASGALGNSFAPHLAATNAAGRAFSPGTLPDGTPFGSTTISRIEISPASATLDIGASQTFSARAFVSGGAGEAELPNVSLSWDADAPASLSLSPASGATTTATASTPGGFTVRARAGGHEATAIVTVNPPPPVLARVELSPTFAAFNVGDARQFTARAFDQYDQPYPRAQISFASSDAAVASVDSVAADAGHASATATVTGRLAGTARLTATARDGSNVKTSNEASLQIVIPPPVVKRVVVSPQGAGVNRGQSQQFTAQAFDKNDQLVPSAAFTWTTTDAQVATVTADGVARGVGIGTTNVVATTPDGAGQTISAQAALVVRAPLVINEILADVPPDNAGTSVVEGDANRDGVRNADDDEFVELLNNSDAPLDLSGVRISDSTANRFTFPVATTLAAGQAAIVFGGGAPALHDPALGGALVFTAASLGLNDGGDLVTVKLPTAGGDIVIATQAFGSGATGAPPAPSDQSLTRSPDAGVGTTGGDFAPHTSATHAAARAFSPGTRADGTPFGSPALSRIEITPASARIDIGASQPFSARAFAIVGNSEIEVVNVAFAWDSSDATKATVAPASGVGTNATALGAGTTSVRARAGGIQTTAALVVNPPPPVLTRVEIAPASSTLVVGQTQQFTARALDQFDQPYAGATFAFNSDDANVARVESVTNNGDGSADGVVSGRAPGVAHITATASSGASVITSNAVTITVTLPPPVLTRITVSPASATVAAGESQQFTARGFDQNGQEMTGLSFAWASSDQTVATLSQSGLATTLKGGTTQITASSGSVTSAAATLSVTPPPVAAAGQVIINEALVSFATSTTQPRADFLELFNTTGQTLDISGLVVSFRASGNTSAISTVTLPGVVGSRTTLIVPHAYFLIAGGTTTFGVAADFDASTAGFNLNDTTGGIKIEIGGVKLDGLTYQSGSSAPAAPFNAYGEGALLSFTSGATNDLIRSPNATDTNNNATDFRRNGTTASVSPRAANP